MKHAWILALALVAATTACERSANGPAASSSAPPVKVFAAASLKEAVTEIAEEWARKSGGRHQLTFEATSTLGRQIQEGAPADLFLTAAPEWLDPVKTKERCDWLTNRLVLVVAKGAPDVAPADLGKLGSLSLANEQVPAGKYARAAFAFLKVALPERLLLDASVRDVLAKVSEGGAQAGVVYATDAAIDPNVRVAYTFPLESHPKIVYSVGLLNESGRALYDALRAPWALEIAKRRGFQVP
jgi:molybdate transport system substrate-binding protein